MQIDNHHKGLTSILVWILNGRPVPKDIPLPLRIQRLSAAGLQAKRHHQSTGVYSQVFSADARSRVSATKRSSFNDSKLISTFASAPVSAAWASAMAVVKSDFIFGFVIGPRFSAIRATSATRSATPSGTLVACLSAALIAPSPSADSFAALYAFITRL